MSFAAFIVRILQKTTNMQPYRAYLETLKEYPRGTVGREVAGFMESNNYHFIPGFANHQMKHVLLGYDATAEDEVRMQAFMLGNGNFSPFCVLSLLLGVGMPGLFTLLVQDYRAGKKCVSIVNWRLEDVAHMPVNRLRDMMFTGMTMRPGDMKARK
jgi:ubiquinone biosynthesis protein Coq4